MQISTNDWTNYIAKLRKLSNTAADKMQQYVQKNGFGNTDELIEYAYALVTKYGEGSSELACQMYDAVAEMSEAGVEAAVPAATATYAETAGAVQGSLLQSPTGQKLTQVADRLVKLAAADTLVQNAIRDKAQWAWIPSGDTCSFCLVLASRGWQNASNSALKGNHASHIHANCDCMYQIRFDSKTNVAGYDPDKLREQYYAADGSSSKDKINSLRRANYAANADKIRAQKRAAYAARTGSNIFGANSHMKTGKMTSQEYALSRNPLENFDAVSQELAVPTARAESKSWLKSIDNTAKKLISKYTYNSNDSRPQFFERINAFIRNGNKGEIDYSEQVNIISSALKKSKLENNYKCYRGSDFNPFEGLKIGETGKANQFLSSSLKKSGAFKGKFTIMIYAEKGTNAAYVEEISAKAFKKQREMLFDKDVDYELLYQKDDLVIVRAKP